MPNCALLVQLLQNCSYTSEPIELKFIIVTTPQLCVCVCVCVCMCVLKPHCGDLLRTSVLVERTNTFYTISTIPHSLQYKLYLLYIFALSIVTYLGFYTFFLENNQIHHILQSYMQCTHFQITAKRVISISPIIFVRQSVSPLVSVCYQGCEHISS